MDLVSDRELMGTSIIWTRIYVKKAVEKNYINWSYYFYAFSMILIYHILWGTLYII